MCAICRITLAEPPRGIAIPVAAQVKIVGRLDLRVCMRCADRIAEAIDAMRFDDARIA